MKDLVDLVKQRGPITRAELSKRLKVTEREVRAIIHDLNLAGIPIVSDGRGFCYAKTGSQAKAAAGRIASQAVAMIRRAAAIRKIDVARVVRELPL